MRVVAEITPASTSPIPIVPTARTGRSQGGRTDSFVDVDIGGYLEWMLTLVDISNRS
jgi:hypothetical protein